MNNLINLIKPHFLYNNYDYKWAKIVLSFINAFISWLAVR